MSKNGRNVTLNSGLPPHAQALMDNLGKDTINLAIQTQMLKSKRLAKPTIKNT
jgi:hypothetical protein